VAGQAYGMGALQAEWKGWRGEHFMFLKGFYSSKLDTSTGFSQTLRKANDASPT